MRARPPLSPFVLAFVCSLLAASCDDGGLRIEPVEPQVAFAGEFLDVPFTVRNPGGGPVSFAFDGPALPFLDRWMSVVPGPGGGRLHWDPQLEHVGVHRITLLASTPDERASRAVEIEVVRAREATPVFVEPPKARAFDLGRDACIELPIEVRDNDSDDVELSVPYGLPSGATLELTSDRTAMLRWCPTPDQVAARALWRITLRADDGEHAPVDRDLRLVLLTPQRDDCDGAPPAVRWLQPDDGAAVVSEVGYEVRIEVEDDSALRHAPLLFFTDGRLDQRDRIDVATLQAAVFEPDGDAWRARVPTFRLAEDEARTITMIPWVTDDDDPAGTRCDRRAPFRARTFVAVGAVEAGVLPLCAPCTQSGDCQSNVCLATPTGGRCAPACDDDTPCAAGTCSGAPSPEGVVRQGCGPVSFVCDGEPACEDDDVDATFERATDGVVCGRSGDERTWTARTSGPVTFELQSRSLVRAAAPDTVEMTVLSDGGFVRAVDSGDGALRSVTVCAEPGETLTVLLESPTADQASWELTATQADSACDCRPLAVETDAVGPEGSTRGEVCGGGYADVPLGIDGAGRHTLFLEWTGEAPLAVEILDDDDRRVTRAGARTSPLTLTLDTDGPRAWRARVTSPDGVPLGWSLAHEVTPLASCERDADCVPGEICESSERCMAVVCERNADCPGDTICPRVTNTDAARTCAPACEQDADCASGERCKAFPEGRTCRPEGDAPVGEACQSADDCAGARVCLDWTDGYCAAAGCDALDVCAAGEICAVVDNQAVCLASCWVSDDVCVRDAPYACDEVFGPDSEVGYACTPTVR